ncbi:MAG: hypothetical protein KKB30_05090 [Proteobacteria bacterium]|nr:hypothetical protein [Pseudomonadota bacterium]MBU1714592.1 hypothetical protein [Pseudomonadota bacterium]
MNLSKVIKVQRDSLPDHNGDSSAPPSNKEFMPFDSLWRKNDDDGVDATFDPQKMLKTEMAEAEAKAAEFLRQARAEAEKIKKQAYQEGLANGQKEGKSKGLEEYNDLNRRLKGVLQSIEEKCQKIDRQFDAELFELVKAMVDRLVNHEVSVNPRVIKACLAKAMEFVVENTTVKVSLNPEDFNRFKEAGLDSQSLLEGRNRIQLVEDPGISEGGCLLATGYGEVDVTLEHRSTLLYDAVERSFMVSLAEDRSG